MTVISDLEVILQENYMVFTSKGLRFKDCFKPWIFITKTHLIQRDSVAIQQRFLKVEFLSDFSKCYQIKSQVVEKIKVI